MKHITAQCILLVILTTFSFAQSFPFDHIKWGMSKRQVKGVVKYTFVTEGGPMNLLQLQQYNGYLYSIETLIVYTFAYNKLISIKCTPNIEAIKRDITTEIPNLVQITDIAHWFLIPKYIPEIDPTINEEARKYKEHYMSKIPFKQPDAERNTYFYFMKVLTNRFGKPVKQEITEEIVWENKDTEIWLTHQNGWTYLWFSSRELSHLRADAIRDEETMKQNTKKH